MNQENYLKTNLIAYIGNKRNLLDLIKKSIEKTKPDCDNELLFLDLFAGSGSVSRLAKSLGFKVYSNDWEYYSYILNKTFVGLDHDFLKKSFKNLGGVANVIETLNNLTLLQNKDKYISLYYCPKDDNKPDIKNERMFYTNYNGKKIDAVRAKIEEWAQKEVINEDEEAFLLALLIYEASVRSNTSGVFKGFHQGFGGTNHDALSRILKPISFSVPSLINGKKSSIFREDALKLSKELKDTKFDVVYLDPPYNQHQYGSNYHLLNTIALNDKPSVNKEIFINGKKINKSAIRRDWINTKSSFCYKKNAKEDFKEIIENVNAKHILISYSTDGIIPFNDMLEILSAKGKLDIELCEYVKYRGGKQALTTKVNNIEFVLIVNTKEKGSLKDIAAVKRTLLLNKINMLSKKTINVFRAEETGFIFKNNINGLKNILEKKYGNKKVSFEIINHKIENIFLNILEECPAEIIESVYNDIEYITNLTREDEIYLSIENIYKYYKESLYSEAVELFKEIPYLVSKFNNKKNYILSLKTIISVFEMLIQTKNMWQKNNLIKLSSFNKLEKIIFLKLNYDFKANLHTGKSDDLKVDGLKKKISSLYEYFINMLENEEKVQERKESSKIYINKTENMRRKISLVN